MIFSDCNKRTQYNSAPWHTRYFCNSTFWPSIYGIYVIPSTKISENVFKGNIQLFTTIAKFDFWRPKKPCNWNQNSWWIFFSFWEVNFDVKDIKPSLERSTKICRLGSALLECPEHLLGFGDLWVAKQLANWCAKEGSACCFELLCRLWYVFRGTNSLKWVLRHYLQI